jgi:hypothetical protein
MVKLFSSRHEDIWGGGEVELYLHSFLSYMELRGELDALPLYSWKGTPSSFALDTRLGEPQSQRGRYGENKDLQKKKN